MNIKVTNCNKKNTKLIKILFLSAFLLIQIHFKPFIVPAIHDYFDIYTEKVQFIA